MKKILLVFLFFSFICWSDVGLGLKVGTTGPGLDLTFGLREKLNLRTGVSYYNISGKLEKADARIEDSELNLLNIPLLIDWHPFGGGFRLSLGAFYTDNYVSAKAKDQKVTINDREYTVSNLSGKISLKNNFAPYFGIGIGNAINKSNRRLHFSLDIGVMYSGSPDISLTATAYDPDPNVQRRLQEQLNQDIEEQKKKFKDEADNYKFYPVITFGISYAF
jgi:hypothetical protein